jgi:hypothetical protein
MVSEPLRWTLKPKAQTPDRSMGITSHTMTDLQSDFQIRCRSRLAENEQAAEPHDILLSLVSILVRYVPASKTPFTNQIRTPSLATTWSYQHTPTRSQSLSNTPPHEPFVSPWFAHQSTHALAICSGPNDCYRCRNLQIPFMRWSHKLIPN